MTFRQLSLPLFALLLIAAFIFSCQNASTPEYAAPASKPSAEAADAPVPQDATAAMKKAPSDETQKSFHSAAAEPTRWDTLKKLVRTAEVRFRTPDVLKATLAIEDIVRQNGGFILDDNLTQTQIQQHLTTVSKDSSLETSVLNIENHLLFRVPYARLDTTLRAIAPWVELLEYRRIRAEDKTFNWIEEQLAEFRSRQYETRIESATAQPGNKLGAVTAAIDKSLAGRAAADAAHLEQLRLDDAVRLSTVQVDLYQRPVVRRDMIANLKQVASWRPGFGSQLADAFADGWQVLQGLFLLIIRIWSILLIAGLIWLAVWRWKVFQRNQSHIQSIADKS